MFSALFQVHVRNWWFSRDEKKRASHKELKTLTREKHWTGKLSERLKSKNMETETLLLLKLHRGFIKRDSVRQTWNGNAAQFRHTNVCVGVGQLCSLASNEAGGIKRGSMIQMLLKWSRRRTCLTGFDVFFFASCLCSVVLTQCFVVVCVLQMFVVVLVLGSVSFSL